MKTPSEHDELLADLLAESASPDFRAASLEKTLTAARTRRRQGYVVQLAGVAVCAALLAVSVRRAGRVAAPPLAKTTPAQAAAKTIPGTNIRLVSDEELLAMFPGRPVALVGPPEDRRFVFLDEQRNAAARGGSPHVGQNL